MPLIGARFYTIIDDVFTRGDQIENELRYEMLLVCDMLHIICMDPYFPQIISAQHLKMVAYSDLCANLEPLKQIIRQIIMKLAIVIS